MLERGANNSAELILKKLTRVMRILRLMRLVRLFQQYLVRRAAHNLAVVVSTCRSCHTRYGCSISRKRSAPRGDMAAATLRALATASTLRGRRHSPTDEGLTWSACPQAAKENAIFELKNGMATTAQIKKGWYAHSGNRSQRLCGACAAPRQSAIPWQSRVSGYHVSLGLACHRSAHHSSGAPECL